ncbi:MAG TPA: hypothetical protein VNK95_14815, partial [Caldilineaceae bacterium]|nr:hypothetical protein [Caldilineaceae bacterium]
MTADPANLRRPRPYTRPDAGSATAIARIHGLLTVQTIVVVLLTINRLSSLTLGYVAANGFLRWVDFHNLLTLPLISLVSLVLLKNHLEQLAAAAGVRVRAWLGLVFVLGVYLYGAGYGAHEVTNYLHTRFCASGPADDLCAIVIFNDDSFSHWVWFAGFVLLNGALLLLQADAPLARPLGWGDVAWLALNGLFIAAGIFANLAFETIGLDLYIVAAL